MYRLTMYQSDIYTIESHNTDASPRHHDILYSHDLSRYTIANMVSSSHHLADLSYQLRNLFELSFLLEPAAPLEGSI